ncbi:Ail/Lom family outer membrane beta-barrel protein [Izhakiella australiensis]|nr:Ail/Lom family outer membrane beta-barrel protein [Izhakiella australiensis]
MMKKTLLALALLPLFSSVAQADQQSVTLGWAHTSTSASDVKNLDGINVKYRYEWDSPVGIIGSFSWMKGDDEFSFSYDGHGKTKVNIYSLMVGPAWRINEYVSLYGLVGANFADIKVNASNAYSSADSKWNGSNFAWGAGVQINPMTNLVIDVGYEGSQLKPNGESFDLNGFNIGVGYKF